MTTVLLVANQTLAGGEVETFVRSRLSDGPPSEFTLLVPATPQDPGSGDRAARLLGAAVVGAATRTEVPAQDAEDAGYQRARSRLDFGLGTLSRLGATVDGEVGDEHPFKAISDVLARRHFDEVVLFTLPPAVSRWLHLDIPRRVERKFHVPVTVITTG